MEWYFVLALIGIGIFAGFINTTAGGGSMLTVPFLMLLGLPANVANGTNRIAILLQNVVAVRTFQKKKVLNLKTDYRLTIPAVLGALVGALIAVEIDTHLLEKIIAGVMVVMLLLVVLKPDVWLKDRSGVENAKPKFWNYIIFFFIGFYGGFIQIGVGFILLAGLVLGCGHDLVKANALKVFIILMYLLFTIGIFIYSEQVDIWVGLILAIGNMFGGWLGANFSVKGGAKYVRYMLIFAMIIVILNLFGVFK